MRRRRVILVCRLMLAALVFSLYLRVALGKSAIMVTIEEHLVKMPSVL